MNKIFYYTVIIPIVLSVFISVFFTPFLSIYAAGDDSITISETKINISYKGTSSVSSPKNFMWPLPGYTKVTSGFGNRKAPTSGASSYHGGIDISAPEGSSIVSMADGTVSFVGWYGANGYTVTIEHADGYKSTYGHVSPSFIVSKGDKVSKGDLIAKVGPKYVSKTSYTKYTDKTGKTTNGATTGPHLHFAITKNSNKVNPKTLFNY